MADNIQCKSGNLWVGEGHPIQLHKWLWVWKILQPLHRSVKHMITALGYATWHHSSHFPRKRRLFFFFLVENIWLSSPPLTLDNYSSSPLIQKNTGIRDSSHYDKSKLLIFFLRGKWMFSFIVILPGWYFAPNSCHQNWWQSSHWCSIHSSGWIPKTLPGNSTVLNDFFFFN